MSAAKVLLGHLAKNSVQVHHVYVPPLPQEPAPFISLEAAKKMDEEKLIISSAKALKIKPLPTTYIKPENPPLPLISYEEYKRQKEANDKLVEFMKSKKC